ncbi:MAG: AbrB/MazE/SpoVT family DNA-binding domain-containing protein [Actinobacteria bacterium]|nr:AbrB/MazE/SpoVT family DNA-binding domain-containing protein [Actinomycetota bacterium]
MGISILSKKGWVVIPNEIRQKYGLKKGDKVNIVEYGGVISIIPIPRDVIKETEGLFKGSSSLTEALLKEREKDKKFEN